jgi:hypothetical protein
MRDLLKSLSGCRDVASLRSAMHELSSEFGEIVQLDILTVRQPEKRQALCFLRLESAAKESQLMVNPGVTRFGNELLCVVDLPEESRPAEQKSGPDRANRGGAVQNPQGRSLRHENVRGMRLWFKSARWGGTLLLAARRVLDLYIGWPTKRLIP